MKRFTTLILITALLFVTFISFYPSLKNNFTSWDDDKLLTGNPLIKVFSAGNFKAIFGSYFYGLYHPLVLLSYAFEYHFFKLDPRIYHATNLTLHLLNCVLVFWLFYLFGGGRFVSFIVAALFAVHPAHVESVAWVSERKDVLYALFFLLSLISYVYYCRKDKARYYWLAFFMFVLSLLSKAMAVSLPALLFLYDYFSSRKMERRQLAEKLPFLLSALIFTVIAVFAKNFTGGSLTEEPAPGFINLFTASHRLVFYILRMFLPLKQFYLYIYSPKPGSFLALIFWLSPVLAVLLFAAAVLAGRRRLRKITFGFMFFLITIVPVLPLMNVGYSADRYTYIPSLGLFYLFALGAAWLLHKAQNWQKALLALMVSVIIVICSIATYQKCKIWKDSVSLWSDAIKNHPSLAMFYIKRANAYLEENAFNAAIADYNRALELNPLYVEAYYNRGIAFSQQGDFDKALSDYSRAIALDPHFAACYVNRAVIYLRMNYIDKAILDCDIAIRVNPCLAQAFFYRGNGYSQKKDYDKAIADYSRAIALNNGYTEAYHNRAVSYFMKNEGVKAQ